MGTSLASRMFGTSHYHEAWLPQSDYVEKIRHNPGETKAPNTEKQGWQGYNMLINKGYYCFVEKDERLGRTRRSVYCRIGINH